SAGAQKWMLGPSGAGILFVKKSRHDLLRPPLIGGWNVVSPNFISQREVEFETGGRKFEPGAYTHSVLAGLRAAAELLLEAGPQEVSQQISALLQALQDGIAPAGFEFLTPTEAKNRCGILTFRHPQVAPERDGEVAAAESGAALGGFRLHGWLSRLAMERVPLQKRIVFLFLEPVRCARALLVARRHVTGNRLAERLRFRAFERDDFLRHK